MDMDDNVVELREITKCEECSSLKIGEDRFDWISEESHKVLYDKFISKINEGKIKVLVVDYCPRDKINQ